MGTDAVRGKAGKERSRIRIRIGIVIRIHAADEV